MNVILDSTLTLFSADLKAGACQTAQTKNMNWRLGAELK